MLAPRSSKLLQSVFNLLLIALMLFQQMALPLAARAASSTQTPANTTGSGQSSALSLAQAEADMYAALNRLISLPADAPPAVIAIAQKQLEEAAQRYQEAGLRENKQSSSSSAPSPTDNSYVYSANTNTPHGDQSSWMMLSKPQGNRDAFDKAFTEQLNGSTTKRAETTSNPGPAGSPVAPATNPGTTHAGPSAPASIAPGTTGNSPVAGWDYNSGRSMPNPDEIIVFDDGNFSTANGFNPIPHGDHGNLANVGTCNDCISSIRVGSHVYIVFYTDGNFGGQSSTSYGDIPNMVDQTYTIAGLPFLFNFNDQMSSIKVVWKPCSANNDQIIVYADANYQGECQVFDINDYPDFEASNLFRNDTISSIVVGSNVVVDYYDNTNFITPLGHSFNSIANLSDIGLNDRISSLKVSHRSDVSLAITPPSAAYSNGPIEVTYQFNNTGPGDEPNAQLTLNIPPDMSFASTTIPNCTVTSNITCTGLVFARNVPSSYTVTFNTINVDVHGMRNFTGTVAGANDNIPANDSATRDIPILAQSDLAVQNVMPPATVEKNRAGDTTYQITSSVKNNGPALNPAVTLTMALSPGASIVSSTPSQGSCTGTSCDLGALAANAIATVSSTILVPAAAIEGTSSSYSASATTTEQYISDLQAANDTIAQDTRVTYWNVSTGMPGPGGNVNALALVAGTLYAGGSFGISRWNGTAWESMGNEAPGGSVLALLADGNGGLYAAGDFTNIGPRLAHWDGTTWSAVGGGIANGAVKALALDSDGELYVGGQFTQAGSLLTSNIARWNGTSWQALGLAGVTKGFGTAQPEVRAIVIDGTNVYVGGLFASPAPNIARWNKADNTWSGLGSGISYMSSTSVVHAMTTLNGHLYVAGRFSTVNKAPASNIASWDLATMRWMPLGAGITGAGSIQVNALSVLASDLVVAGAFTQAGGAPIANAARWNGASWQPFGSGLSQNTAYALAVEPTNAIVFFGGNFSEVEPLLASANVASYTNTTTDIAISQSLTPSTPLAGQPLQIVLQVTNKAATPAELVSIRDELPADVSVVSTSADQGSCNNAGPVVSCNLGTLAPSATVNVTINTSVAASLQNLFSNFAAAGSSSIDVSPADNSVVLSNQPVVEADLLTNLTAPATVIAGQPMSYNLSVTNNGGAVATNAVVILNLPAGGAFFVGNTGIACTPLQNTTAAVELRCELGNLAAGASTNASFNFEVAADASNSFSATASASSAASDPSPADATQTVTSAVSMSADLAITLQAPTLIYLPNGESAAYAYNLDITNIGPSLERNATVMVTLPENVSFSSSSSQCSLAGAELTCALGELAVGQSRSFSIQASVQAGTADATILTSSASITSSGNDPQLNNNTASATSTVSTNSADAAANLAISLSAPAQALAGEASIFTLELSNKGAIPSASSISISLPTTVSYDPSLSDSRCIEDSNTAGRITCQIEELAVGASIRLPIAVRLAASMVDATALELSATVSAAVTDPDSANNTANASVTSSSSADLALSVENESNVSAGDSVTVTLTLNNNGPSDASGVTLENPQPDGMLLDSATSSLGTCTIANQNLSCAIGTLPAGESATVELIMTAGSGEITSTATLASTTADPDESNNVAEAAITIAAAERESRDFGNITVTADAFIDLPDGSTQAFGNIWIGEDLVLAGESDTLVIDEAQESFNGDGTLQYLQEEVPIFTGHFTGTLEADASTLWPEDSAKIELKQIGDFAMLSLEINNIDLEQARVNGSSHEFELETEGFTKTLTLNFFVAPGLEYGGTLENFSLDIAGFNFNVENAVITKQGVESDKVTLKLPDKLGGIETSAEGMVITKDSFSIGGADAAVELPEFKLASDKVVMAESKITVVYDGSALMFTGEGTLKVSLPGNKQKNKIEFSISSNGNFNAGLDRITLNIATAKLKLENISISNTGLSVAAGILTLPPSLKGHVVVVHEVEINENGLEVGGGALTVKIPDINFGDGSKVRIAKASIKVEIESDSYVFSVAATLKLNLPQNKQDIVVRAKVNNAGEFSGIIDQLSLTIASAKLQMRAIAFDTNSLRVNLATLQFPENLGNVSGQLQKIRIDSEGLSIGGGSATFPIPDFKIGSTNGFSVTGASATMSFAADSTYKLTLKGTVKIAVKSVSAEAKGSISVDSEGNISGTIAAFDMNIAGLIAQVRDAQINGDTFSVAMVRLATPASWGGAEVAVYNLRISSSYIRIGGGKFKMPDIKAGSIRLGGLEGELREEGNGYVISLAGRFLLAGLGGPSCSLGVGATMFVSGNGTTSLQLEATEDGKGLSGSAYSLQGFELRQVRVGLSGCRIPIAQTGFFLTRVEGQLTLTSGQTVIDLGVTIANSGDLVRGDADMHMQFNPWQLDFNGSITLFSVFKAAELKATARSGYFSADLRLRQVFPPLEGQVSLTAWTQNGEFNLVGRATVALVVREGSIWEKCVIGICISVPPFDMKLAEIGAEFGKFHKGSGSVWGLKGWVQVWKFRAGFYVNVSGDFSIGNVDGYQLITPPSNLQSAAFQAELLKTAGSPQVNQYITSGNDIISDQVVSISTDIMFILSRKGQAPTLELIDPNGKPITAQSYPDNVSVINDAVNGGTQTLIIVQNAQVGTWKSVLKDGARASDYLFQVIGVNPAPVLTDVSVVNKTLTSAQLNWKLTSQEPETTFDVFITAGPIVTTHVVTGTDGLQKTIEQPFFSGTPLLQNVHSSMDGSRSELLLDLSSFKSGLYWIWVSADDGRNPPTRVYAPTPVSITRSWDDTWQANPIVTAGYRSLQLSWVTNTNPDSDFYKVELATQPGLVEDTYEVGDQKELLIENLTAGQPYYLTVVGLNQETGQTTRSETITAVPLGADVDLSISNPTQTVISGQSVTANLVVKGNVTPYPTSVFMSTHDLPDGMSVSFSSADGEVMPSFDGTALTAQVKTSNSMPGGVYEIPFKVQGEGVQDEAVLTLSVQEPRIEVSANTKSVLINSRAGSATITLSAIGIYGANDAVELSVADLPPGLEYSFSNEILAVGQSSTLTLNDTEAVKNGSYTIRVRAERVYQTQYIPVMVKIQKPSFKISPVLERLSLIRGENGLIAIPVSGEYLSEAVALDLTADTTPIPGAIYGLSSSFDGLAKDRVAVNAPAIAYLKIDTSLDTPDKTYLIMLRAQAHGIVYTKPFEITVIDRANATTADLGISHLSMPDLAVIGTPITYTLQIVNYGPLNAEQVVLNNSLPAEVAAISASFNGGNCQLNAGQVSCQLGTIRRGAYTNVTITGRIQESTATETNLVNSAQVSAQQTEGDSSNNSSIMNVMAVRSVDILTSVSSSASEVIAGDTLDYTVIARNNGPSPAANTELVAEMPGDVLVTGMVSSQGSCTPAGDGHTIRCELGNLGSGASDQALVTIRTRVKSSANAPLIMTSTINSMTSEEVQDNNSTTLTTPVQSTADLKVYHSAVAPLVAIAGSEQVYTFVVANNGLSDASHVVFTNNVPKQFTILTSLTASQGSCSALHGVVTCQLGTIVAGSSAEVLIRGRIDSRAITELNSTASVVSAANEANPADNSNKNITSLIRRNDLKVTSTIPAAGYLQFIVSNLGPSESQAAQLVISMPEDINVQVQTTHGACATVGRQIVCDIGLLASMEQARITLQVSFDPGTLSADFQATVRGGENDPRLENNMTEASLSQIKSVIYLPMVVR